MTKKEKVLRENMLNSSDDLIPPTPPYEDNLGEYPDSEDFETDLDNQSIPSSPKEWNTYGQEAAEQEDYYAQPEEDIMYLDDNIPGDDETDLSIEDETDTEFDDQNIPPSSPEEWNTYGKEAAEQEDYYDELNMENKKLTPSQIANLIKEEDEKEGSMTVAIQVAELLIGHAKELINLLNNGNIRGARAVLNELSGEITKIAEHVNVIAHEKGLPDVKPI